MLDEQLALAEASGQIAWQIEAWILKALALQAQERDAAALIQLERALALAKPERFMRAIVDYGPFAGELLKQVPRQSPVREYARELLAILVTEEGSQYSAPQAPSDA
jgi:LuxR family maltose regulon positive regulatory protein